MQKKRALRLVDEAIKRGEALPPNAVDDLIYIDFHGLAESVIRQTFPMSGRLQEYARVKRARENSLNDVVSFIGILKQHRRDIEDGLIDDIENDDNAILFFLKKNFPVLLWIFLTALLTSLSGILLKWLLGIPQ